MKVENNFSEAIFIAPKVYGGIPLDPSLSEITKVKGFKNKSSDDSKIFNVKVADLKKLLVRDGRLDLSQKKWIRSIGKGHIVLAKSNYSLVATESKRRLITDKNNLFIGTKPYVINKDKQIIG